MGSIGRILKRKPIPPPNHFLGGSGIDFPTAASIQSFYSGGAIAFKRYKNDGPNNEVSFYRRGTYDLQGLNAFYQKTVDYYLDIQGKMIVSNQGVFRSTNIYRFYVPNNPLWRGPSGFFTLNDIETRGYLNMPNWTGEGDNQNHMFNSGSGTNQLDVIYAPKLTRMTLQQTSRFNFQNQTAIRRIVWPRVKNMSAFFDSSIFGNVNPAAIFYLAKEMSYYNNGNENRHVTYWKGLGCTIRYVENQMKPNAINDLAITNKGTTQVDVTFSIPSVNENAIDGYEVWIYDVNVTGEDRWQQYMAHSEATVSGHTVSGLTEGATYRVKLRTFDFYYNVSDFSNEVEFTLNTVGILVGVVNATSGNFATLIEG